jgi:hypothetical protein
MVALRWLSATDLPFTDAGGGEKPRGPQGAARHFSEEAALKNGGVEVGTSGVSVRARTLQRTVRKKSDPCEALTTVEESRVSALFAFSNNI